MTHRQQKQISVYREHLDLLDDFGESSESNTNHSEIIRDLIELADDARDLTGEDDPREALREMRRAYPYSARSGEYNADEFRGTLAEDDIREMCEGERVPAINSDHIKRREVPDDTWIKMGLIAGILRYKFKAERLHVTQYSDAAWLDDDIVDTTKEIKMGKVTVWIRRLCGGQSSVTPSDVLWRAAESTPAVGMQSMQLDDFLEHHADVAETSTEMDGVEKWIANGERLLAACERDGDRRVERVEAALEALYERKRVLDDAKSRELLDKMTDEAMTEDEFDEEDAGETAEEAAE